MPTLHIRNVPEEVYENLRERARERGSSMNSEVVEILADALRWKRHSFDEVMARIEVNAKEIGFGPDWPAPEDLIREDRDSH
ncbi:MAG: Arc family DNA-binding protein [Actinomycetota bacterium]